jgi:hypothetical protein
MSEQANKEKKRRPVPGIPILTAKSAVSNGMSMGVAQVGGGGGAFAKFSAILTSTPALIATVTAAFTISSVGLFDMSERGVFKGGFRDSVANITANAVAGATGKPLPGTDLPPSSLQLAANANQGAFGEPQVMVSDLEDGGEEQEAAGEDVGGQDGAVLGSSDKLQAIEEAEAKENQEEGKDKGDAKARGKLTTQLEKRKIGGTLSLGSGGGMSGGVGRGFDQIAKPAAKGRVKGFSGSRSATVARTKTAARAKGRSGLSGATAKRLAGMNKAMNGARRMGASQSAGTHSQQWDAAGAAGEVIGGEGTGIAGGGPTTGAAGVGPASDGGPIANAGASDPGEQKAPGTGPGKNKTPWQGMMDLVMILMPIASVLLLASTLVAKAGHPAIAKWIAYAAAAVAAMVTVIGISIMAQGQAMQGGMIAGVGALLTGLSVIAAMGHDDAAQAPAKAEQFANTQNLEQLPENIKMNPRPGNWDINSAKGIENNSSFYKTDSGIAYSSDGKTGHLLTGSDIDKLTAVRNTPT